MPTGEEPRGTPYLPSKNSHGHRSPITLDWTNKISIITIKLIYINWIDVFLWKSKIFLYNYHAATLFTSLKSQLSIWLSENMFQLLRPLKTFQQVIGKMNCQTLYEKNMRRVRNYFMTLFFCKLQFSSFLSTSLLWLLYTLYSSNINRVVRW